MQLKVNFKEEGVEVEWVTENTYLLKYIGSEQHDHFDNFFQDLAKF